MIVVNNVSCISFFDNAVYRHVSMVPNLFDAFEVGYLLLSRVFDSILGFGLAFW